MTIPNSKNGYVYILKMKSYEPDYIYKYGRTKYPNRRIKQYTKCALDCNYYIFLYECINYSDKLIENYIKVLLDEANEDDVTYNRFGANPLKNNYGREYFKCQDLKVLDHILDKVKDGDINNKIPKLNEAINKQSHGDAYKSWKKNKSRQVFDIFTLKKIIDFGESTSDMETIVYLLFSFMKHAGCNNKVDIIPKQSLTPDEADYWYTRLEKAYKLVNNSKYNNKFVPDFTNIYEVQMFIVKLMKHILREPNEKIACIKRRKIQENKVRRQVYEINCNWFETKLHCSFDSYDWDF